MAISTSDPTGQAFSSLAWEEDAFTMEPNHELDPDGDLVLILDPSTFGCRIAVHEFLSEGMLKPNQLKIGDSFN